MAPFLDIWNVVEGLLEAMGVSQEKIDIFYVIICSFHFIRHDSDGNVDFDVIVGIPFLIRQ